MVNSVVEEIKSRINIVDFLGEYIRLQKAGANWKALCPFHNEKTPSFMVSEEKQIWHCFGCQKGGDIFGFLMEMEGMEFKEALKMLADKAGVQLKSYRPEAAADKNKVLEILELATKFYETQLWKGMGKGKILNYLHNRGIKDETIKEFRIGYAPPGWRNLLTFLTGRGYKTEDIEKTGLLVKKNNQDTRNNNQTIPNSQFPIPNSNFYDRFRDRITFPINDIMGKVVGFSARVAPGGDESQAKYVNTPETMVYHKSKVLYGADKAKKEIKDKKSAILVEGNMDIIASHQAGIKNTAAISGTALTPEQLEIIKRYSENITMLFDMDSAGEEATAHSAELCFRKGINVFVSRLPEGKDAAELANKDPRLLEQSLDKTVPAAEYLLNKIFARYDKSKADGKKSIAKDALNLIRNFSNEIEKNHWIKKVARELEVEDKILTDALNKTRPAAGRETLADENNQDGSLARERSDAIREKLVGLMLAYPEVWRETAGRCQENEYLNGDKFLRILFQKGEGAGFKIDNLLISVEDEELRRHFQRLAFETKYQFGEREEVEEFDPGRAKALAKNYLDELGRETRKKKLENVAKDIRKAEESGNKEELKLLMEEFSKLSRELK